MSGSGLNITVIEETTAFVTTDHRLWLNADQDRLVVEGDPEAAFFFSVAGQRILKEEAERLGLVSATAPEREPEVEPEQDPEVELEDEEQEGDEADGSEAASESDPADAPKPRRSRGGK